MRIGRRAPAAQRRNVHHVVMKQGCGVDKFDDGGELNSSVIDLSSALAVRSASRGRSRLPPASTM